MFILMALSHGMSRRRAEVAPTLAPTNAGTVTGEPRYAYGAGRWTPSQVRKPH